MALDPPPDGWTDISLDALILRIQQHASPQGYAVVKARTVCAYDEEPSHGASGASLLLQEVVPVDSTAQLGGADSGRDVQDQQVQIATVNHHRCHGPEYFFLPGICLHEFGAHSRLRLGTGTAEGIV